RLARQIMGFLFTGFSVLVIWYTKSRGAMLALAVQILTAGTLKTSGNKWLRMLLLAGLLGAGYVAAVKAIPRDPEDMLVSTENRITYWKAAVNMSLHHPIWGVGYGQFEQNVWQHQTAHSSWFLAFAESGILGGLLFVAFFVAVLWTAWSIRRQYPEQLYALVGYGVAMTFLSHTYLIYPYMLAGLIIASDSLHVRI